MASQGPDELNLLLLLVLVSLLLFRKEGEWDSMEMEITKSVLPHDVPKTGNPNLMFGIQNGSCPCVDEKSTTLYGSIWIPFSLLEIPKKRKFIPNAFIRKVELRSNFRNKPMLVVNCDNYGLYLSNAHHLLITYKYSILNSSWITNKIAFATDFTFLYMFQPGCGNYENKNYARCMTSILR